MSRGLRGVLKRTVRQLSADLRMVFQGVAGEPSAPYQERSATRSYAAASPVASSSSLKPRRVRVVRVTRETPSATSFELADVSGGALTFEAGQFFTILREIEGVVERRAYSASSPADGRPTVSITVKRNLGGLVSNHLCDHLREGEEIEVFGPSGNFTVPSTPPSHVVFVAAGSGITPIMSILHTLETKGCKSRVDVIYGNRSEEETIFSSVLAELARGSEGRLRLHHVREEGEGGRPGRLDPEVLGAIFDEIDPRPDGSMVMLCGPEPVMVAAKQVLSARAYPPLRVRTERFSSLRRDTSKTTEAHTLTVLRDGQSTTIVVPAGKTLLEASGDDGRIPFSCTMGGCGACRVRLVEGDVDLDEPNCLAEDERAEGYVLACVSRPRSACTIAVEDDA